MSAGTGTVLVVDDTPSKRYVISSWLRRAGYTIVEAGTGTEALQLVESNPVDVVVLDVKLPDLTGFAVSERIKARAPHPTPVIHISAAAVDVGDRTQGLARGADAYLVEPIDPDEMVATVQAVLRYYRALRQAERLADRMTRLARATRELNIATNLRDLLRTAASSAATIFDAPALVCAELPEGTRVLVSCTGPGVEPELRPCPRHLFDVPVGVVVRDDPAGDWPELTWPDDGPVRVVGARLRPDRAPVYTAIPAQVTDPGAPVLTQLGQAVAVAIDVLRAYQEEHTLALTLQRSLLPATLPKVEGYDMAVRYVPASEQAEVGGDFYELSVVDGRLAVAVGDVAGHSLHAATVMAELRHATRAYLAEGHPPSAVLDRLNQLMMRLIPNEMATLCLLLIEPETGLAWLANAGHPPPLLSYGGGRTEYLSTRSALLGLRAERAPDAELTIPPGATLVLYTDGLIERRRDHIDTGLDALARAAARVEDDLEAFCDRLLTQVGPATPDDDIAILTLRRAGRRLDRRAQRGRKTAP
jgi:DNA-binding response OmpR family regulator